MSRSRSVPRFVLLVVGWVSMGTTACKDDDAAHGGVIVLGDASVSAGEPTGLEGITDLHNQTRAMVSPPAQPALSPLTWSPTLAATAQAWADGCVYAHSNGSYGENIFASAGSSPTAYDVVSSWASESVDYVYSGNDCSGVCGHYTQIVWRETTALGCGIAHCTANSPFGAGSPTWDLVVCEYDPPGNYIGERPY